jgi:LmbE family N-acetylglucosaminyl deacetylase
MKMLNLIFNKPKDSPISVLCLGAHSDDIEIGVGGTILKLINYYPNAKFYWVVLGANHANRAEEALASANIFLSQAGGKEVFVKGFRDGFFPYIGAEIKEYFEGLKPLVPDVIFTHYRHDLHQDHRFLCELTWNTFRDHLIVEYEIPKYDGDLGAPNLFVQLDKALCNRKIKYILDNFETQGERHWFTADTFWSILRLRGIESKSPDQYAEAFYCRKAVIF